MEEKILVWLHDIKVAVEKANSFFNSRERSFNAFYQNKILRKAVESNFEIIDKAINRALKEYSNFPITDTVKLVPFEIKLHISTTNFNRNYTEYLQQISCYFVGGSYPKF